MNDTPHEHDASTPVDSPELPADLVDALRALDGPATIPSAEHDAALLAGAREHLAGIGIQQVQRRDRSRHVLAFIGAGGAVAAAAAAAVTFAVIVGQGDNEQAASPAVAQNNTYESSENEESWRPTDAGRPATPGTVQTTGDLDRSGTLDILDAFALARAIERSDGDPASASNDFNGDGRVDTRDADWLAQRAVTVRPDGGQV